MCKNSMRFFCFFFVKKKRNPLLQARGEFVADEGDLRLFGSGGRVHSCPCHSVVDLVLHREDIREGAGEFTVDIATCRFDGAVHHQVALALEDEKKVFHRLLFVHCEINPIIL